MASFRAIRYLTSFVFLAVLFLGSVEASRAPILVVATAVILFVLGIPIAVYAFAKMERYRDVFDYEPTELWGKSSNGKQARATLMAVSTTGLLCSLSGVALFLIVSLNVRVV